MIIKSVQKACAILKCLSDKYPDGMRLDEICVLTGINKSTCVHLLDTLIDEQLAERMCYANYRLAAGCFHLTRFGTFDGTRLSVCAPLLKWLHSKVGETVLIAEIQNCTKYIVRYIESELTLRSNAADIIVDDIYRTATGRLILSRISEEAVSEIVYKLGLPKKEEWKGFKSAAELKAELSDMKKRKIVISENTCGSEKCVGMAAEICDSSGIVGAVGIAFLKRNDDDKTDLYEKYGKYLLQASNEMSRRLKFEK